MYALFTEFQNSPLSNFWTGAFTVYQVCGESVCLFRAAVRGTDSNMVERLMLGI